MQYPIGEYSLKAFSRFELLAGVDEVGRGPLAGPVVASAVVFRKGFELEGLKDSKKLSPKRRAELCEKIIDGAESVHWAFVGEALIDEVNIYQAARQAMESAVSGLSVTPQAILVDAMHLPSIAIDQTSLVKGDQREPCIMAASIVAKEVRDKFMRQLGELYPEYGFEKHMGYGTVRHMSALKRLGVLDCHRRSFKPVMKVLLNDRKALERELLSKSKAELIGFVGLVRQMGLSDCLRPNMNLINSRLQGKL
tara:strand:+ start:3425 stop:4180 length:756 start_codon:yes stop_codon:yes gene_type:complete